jgi:hypothetical protein
MKQLSQKTESTTIPDHSPSRRGEHNHPRAGFGDSKRGEHTL